MKAPLLPEAFALLTRGTPQKLRTYRHIKRRTRKEEDKMRQGLRWLLLPAAALGLASCAEGYDYYGSNGYGYYGPYADYAYPPDFYGPFSGGLIVGGFGHRDFDRHAFHHGGAFTSPAHFRSGAIAMAPGVNAGMHPGAARSGMGHGGMGHGGHGDHH
jgi:hypothetical protein